MVYNLDAPMLQDGVPNYIRNPVELTYLLTHFEALIKVDSFLILGLRPSVDFSKICVLAPQSHLCFWQSEVQLGMIPASEGRYKLGDYQPENFNENLALHPQSSRIVLFVYPKHGDTTQQHLIIHTADKLKTTINFDACVDSYPCLINLDHLPYFYVEKQITGIESSHPIQALQFSTRTTTQLW